MTWPARLRAASLGALFVAGATVTACDAIFGISAGTPDTSTSTGTSTGTETGGGGSGGSCGTYDGDATASWKAAAGSTPNVILSSFHSSDNTDAQDYQSVANATELSFESGGEIAGTSDCAEIYLAFGGRPVAGTTYTVIDGSACNASSFSASAGDVACLSFSWYAGPDGGATCGSATPLVFGSVAGMGTVEVKAASGASVTVSASGVQLAAVQSTGAVGTLALELDALAACVSHLGAAGP
jgi:hypothetical protein